jgi:chemotaxis protein CheX
MIQYIQPFAKACKMVFKKFMGAELMAERPYFFNDQEVRGWDLFAIIGFTGEARGAVVISMKKDLAFKIANTLTGKNHKEMDQDVLDAIGEIINIIAGHVKQGLENTFRLVISLPIVVQGQDHSISWLAGNTHIICIPFNIFEDDGFLLSISLETKGGNHES